MSNTTNLLKSAAGIALGLALMQATAKADYDLTLIPLAGQDGGTGTFSVAGPVPNSGWFFFDAAGSGANQLTAFDITIDSHTFDLSDAVSDSSGAFYNGSLAGLFYNGSIGALHLSVFGGLDGTVIYILTGQDSIGTQDVNGQGYRWGDTDGESNTLGMIMAGTEATVPEPTSFLLFGSVALLAGTAVRRKLRRL
jgi:hypothetical protein